MTEVQVLGETPSGMLQVVLFANKGETNWDRSINAQLLQKGLAALAEDLEMPAEAEGWHAMQEQARDDQIGLWQYGGIDDIDDE